MTSIFLAALLLTQATAPRVPVEPPGAWISHGPEGGGGPIADPRAPQALYTTTGAGVFFSGDGGASWVSRSEGLTEVPGLVVGVDDPNPPALYGRSPRHFFSSLDGGLTWELSDEARFPLAVDPASPGRVFAQALSPDLTTCSIDVSEDAGRSWRTVYPCTWENGTTAIVFDPQSSRTVYMSFDASFSNPVQKSLDGGETWSSAGQGLPDGARSLVINRHDPLILYTVGGSDTVYKTADGGATWRTTSAQPPIGPKDEILSLAVDPTNGNVYAATLSGLYRSAGGDAEWTLVSPLFLNGLTIFDDPSAPFFATAPDGPLRSDDHGVSWHDASGGLYGAQVWALAESPASVVYAATWRSVFASEDRGDSWTKRPYSFPNGSVITALVAASDPGILSAATNADGVQMSTDGGATWAAAGTGLSSTSIARLVRTPSGVLIAAGDTGLYRLDSSGVWTSDSAWSGAVVTALAASPSTDGVVYAGSIAGVSRTADAGVIWAPTSRPDLGEVQALAVDPNDSRVLYVDFLAAYPGGLVGMQKSTDSGLSWLPIPAIDTGTGCLAVDPSDSQNVYACSTSTISRSLDGGLTWAPFDQGISFSPSVTGFAIDPDGQRVHVSTLGQSVLDRTAAGRTTQTPLR
jgi:photosystem II stability/assembly factor-like uncharacterized protein